MKVKHIDPNRVLYEDNHLIVVDKFPGDIVQADISSVAPMSEMIKAYIKEKYNKPGNVYLGVIHRLDQPTSGAVIFAKTSKALVRMNKMIKTREIKKTYLTLVHGVPEKEENILVHHLWRNTEKNKTTAFGEANEQTKMAQLYYKTLHTSNNYAVVEVDLHTGRHHQIRTQMQAIGHSIKNDRKYGAKRIDSNYDGIFLHAWKLSFIHPVKKMEVKIEAPIPWPIEEVSRLGLSLPTK